MKKFILLIMFLLMSFFLVNGKLYAASIEVSNWSQLSSALNSNYNTIVLKSGSTFTANSKITISNKTVSIIPESNKNITIARSSSFTENFIEIKTNSNVTIGSNNGKIIFNGQSSNTNNKSIFNINTNSTVRFNNIEINNNNTNTYGGAILIKASVVQIENSKFSKNSGTYGGAIFVSNSTNTLNIFDSTISNNTAKTGSGGGIYAYGSMNINSSTISNNTAQTFGGGVMIKNVTSITNSNITSNKAVENKGGGVKVDGKLMLANTNIKNNTSNQDGAGLDFCSGLYKNNGGNTITGNYTNSVLSNIHPDVNSSSNVNWRNDSSLKLETINAEIIKKVNDNGTQGFVVAGNYIVVSNWVSDSDPTNLLILDKNTLELKNTITFGGSSSSYNLSHANDLAYDKNTGYIYALSSRKSSSNEPMAVKFKLNSSAQMTNLEYFVVPRTFSGIEYDSDNNYFILLSSRKIYIYTKNFELVRQFSTPTNLTSQGIGFYKGYIYFVCFEAGLETIYQSIYNVEEKGSNLIYVYNLNGSLVKTLHLYGLDFDDVLELEGASFLDTGELIMNANYSGTVLLKSTYTTQVKEISIKKLPNKLTYKVGESIDITGLQLNVKYNNETTSAVTSTSNMSISGFNSQKVGKQTITVKYKGKSTTFTIEVVNGNSSTNTIVGSVTISGTTTWGNTLTANPKCTTPSSGCTFDNYKWYANGSLISGATSRTYSISKEMVGKKITVSCTAHASNYANKTLTSSATTEIKKKNVSVVVNPYNGNYDGNTHYANIMITNSDWEGTIVSGTNTNYSQTVVSKAIANMRYSLLPGYMNTNYSAITIYYKIYGNSYYNDHAGSTTILINQAGVTKPKVSLIASNNAIKISWDNQTSASKYIVYRSNDNKKWSAYKTITTNSLLDKSLTYNKSYYYKVKACDNTKCSAYSNTVGKKVLPNKVKLSIKNASTTNIRLQWDRVATNGYVIYRSTNKKTWTKVATISKNTTLEYNNTKLKANTSYYYKVRAYKTLALRKVYGPWSDIVATRTAPLAPAVSLSIKEYNEINIKIAESTGATHYYVYKSYDNDSYNRTYDITSPGIITDGPHKLGTPIYYKIRACNAWNRCSSFVTKGIKQSAKTPTFSLTSTKSKTVTISLNQVEYADGYEVYRSTSKNGKYTLVKSITNNSLTINNTTKKGHTYYYRVRSFVLVDGNKVFSPLSSVKNIESK